MKKFRLRPLWFNTDPAAPAGGGGAPPTPTPAAPPAVVTTPTPSAPAGGSGTPPAAITSEPWFRTAPTTWRDDLVATLPEDTRVKGKSILERVPSIEVFTHNYVNAQQRLSSGLPPDTVAWLPKDHTPEQLTEYRKKVDVPDTSDKYEMALDAGLVLSPNDRKMFSPIFATLHAANVPTPVVSQLVNEYLKLDQQTAADIKLRDEQDTQTCRSALRKVWGVDYERNLGLVEMFLVDLPKEVREAFTGGRLTTGQGIFNSPEVVMFLLSKQREINPLATVVTQTGGDGVKAIDDELAAMRKRMGEDPTWHSDAAANKRYRDLLDAKAALAKK